MQRKRRKSWDISTLQLCIAAVSKASNFLSLRVKLVANDSGLRSERSEWGESHELSSDRKLGGDALEHGHALFNVQGNGRD